MSSMFSPKDPSKTRSKLQSKQGSSGFQGSVDKSNDFGRFSASKRWFFSWNFQQQFPEAFPVQRAGYGYEICECTILSILVLQNMNWKLHIPIGLRGLVFLFSYIYH